MDPQSSLHIFDSLSGTKKLFTPISPTGAVKLYACGVTVYDFCHVGHGRTSVAVDTIVRHLRYLGYDLTYVRNVTDIDDKIIRRAEQEATTPVELARLYTETMRADERWLGNLDPDQSPRASHYIEKIQSFISSLLRTGYAYVAGSGDVYFRVHLAKSYGQLSGRDIHEMNKRSRIENKPEKEDPLDFALWKAAGENEVGWRSPWGWGRPGWHIECSTMVHDCLGERIDIHAGGKDLIFPHHENEIAQTESRFGGPMANFWVHVGSVMAGEDKMSKSLKNFVLLNELKEQYSGQALRFYYLQSHYRSPLSFDFDQLHTRLNSWARINSTYQRHVPEVDLEEVDTVRNKEDRHLLAFDAAMNDDFNTPEALAVIFDVVREINTAGHAAASRELALTLLHMLKRLGLLEAEDIGQPMVDEQQIEEQIQQRQKAREDKDWEAADHIRDQLIKLGILIEDHSDGTTTWRLERG